jgi:hypothetical protein
MLRINTRTDLEALAGTEAYAEALRRLRGSMVAKVNVAVYPDGYFEDGYDGPEVEPVWEEVENLEALNLLGLDKAEFLAECERVLGTDGEA